MRTERNFPPVWTSGSMTGVLWRKNCGPREAGWRVLQKDPASAVSRKVAVRPRKAALRKVAARLRKVAWPMRYRCGKGGCLCENEMLVASPNPFRRSLDRRFPLRPPMAWMDPVAPSKKQTAEPRRKAETRQRRRRVRWQKRPAANARPGAGQDCSLERGAPC